MPRLPVNANNPFRAHPYLRERVPNTTVRELTRYSEEFRKIQKLQKALEETQRMNEEMVTLFTHQEAGMFTHPTKQPQAVIDRTHELVEQPHPSLDDTPQQPNHTVTWVGFDMHENVAANPAAMYNKLAVLRNLSSAEMLMALNLATEAEIGKRTAAALNVIANIVQPSSTPPIQTEMALEKEDKIILLRAMAPSIPYFGFIKQALHKKVMEEAASLSVRQLTPKTTRLTVLKPSLWLEHIIDMLDKATTTNSRGTAKTTMFNKCYTTFSISEVDAAGKPMLEKTVKSYAPDLPYLLSRFGSLCSTLAYTPTDTIKVLQSDGTVTPAKTGFLSDSQLYVHFAYSMMADVGEYSQFLKDEPFFAPGGGTDAMEDHYAKYIKFIEYMSEAYFKIADMKDECELYIGQDQDFNLLLNQTMRRSKLIAGKTSNDDQLGVPEAFLEHLMPFIVTNMQNFSRQLQNLRQTQYTGEGDPNNPLRVLDSPIGRYINFDYNSEPEFTQAAKNSGINPTDVQVTLISPQINLRKFMCVKRIYHQICVCHATMTNYFLSKGIFIENKPEHRKDIYAAVIEFFSQLMVSADDRKQVRYIPTLESFPGFLIYTSLCGSNNDVALQRLPGTYSKGVNIFNYSEYYDMDATTGRNGRLKSHQLFLETLSTFFGQIQTMSETKMGTYIAGFGGEYNGTNNKPNYESIPSTHKLDVLTHGMRMPPHDVLQTLKVHIDPSLQSLGCTYIYKTMRSSTHLTPDQQWYKTVFLADPDGPGDIITTSPDGPYRIPTDGHYTTLSFGKFPIAYKAHTYPTTQEKIKKPTAAKPRVLIPPEAVSSVFAMTT